MTQINTNIYAINTKRSLDNNGSYLSGSLQRLSSGLRINTAKDDVAGLSIATRFTANINGFEQAKRNSVDAMSLLQTAEGAMGEVLGILQRARELAVQSANNTNSASDRKSLQAEVNQLKSELNAISRNTSFNNVKILNGDLSSSEMQIGAAENETISISISSVHGSQLGANNVYSSNNLGIEQATHMKIYGYGYPTDIGSDIAALNVATTNGYSADTFTVTNSNSSGNTVTQSYTSSSNDTIMKTAYNLNALNGVVATGFNEIGLQSLSGMTDGSDSITFTFDGVDSDGNDTTFSINATGTSGDTLEELAALINADANARAADIFAVNGLSAVGNPQIKLYALQGHDITTSVGGGASIAVYSRVRPSFLTPVASDLTVGGRLDVSMDSGYSISGNDLLLNTTTGGRNVGRFNIDSTSESRSTTNVSIGNGGNFNNSQNNVGAQNIMISGSNGTTTVAITAGQSADSIATSINAESATTGVRASATTTVTIDNLSHDGTISMELFGNNVSTSIVSASVTTSDLSSLVTAINDLVGTTGISAAIGTDNSEVILTHSEGKDIKITNFTHSSTVDYPLPSSTPISGDGSEVLIPDALYTIRVRGGEDTTAITLNDGGSTQVADSTIIGGRLMFSSDQTFSVSSDVSNELSGVGTGSLFSTGVSVANASTESKVSDIDIGTAAGAQSAISVLDEAIQLVSSSRAEIGALDSRVTATIRSLSNAIENLSNSRSRIMDVDFATEMSSLTKSQILQQAGMSILSQANQAHQSILSLLQ